MIEIKKRSFGRNEVIFKAIQDGMEKANIETMLSLDDASSMNEYRLACKGGMDTDNLKILASLDYDKMEEYRLSFSLGMTEENLKEVISQTSQSAMREYRRVYVGKTKLEKIIDETTIELDNFLAQSSRINSVAISVKNQILKYFKDCGLSDSFLDTVRSVDDVKVLITAKYANSMGINETNLKALVKHPKLSKDILLNSDYFDIITDHANFAKVLELKDPVQLEIAMKAYNYGMDATGFKNLLAAPVFKMRQLLDEFTEISFSKYNIVKIIKEKGIDLSTETLNKSIL